MIWLRLKIRPRNCEGYEKRNGSDSWLSEMLYLAQKYPTIHLYIYINMYVQNTHYMPATVSCRT